MPKFYVTPTDVNNSASLNNIAASAYAQLSSANFTAASVGGNAIATQSYVTGLGYQTTSGSVTNATNAVNTAITNDTSTSTAQYITFTSASIGNAPQKTTAASLTYTPSTGILVAPKFSGNGSAVTGVTGLYNGATLIAEVTTGNEFTLHRVNSASEGGQINFNRSTDDTTYWNIDVYGNTASPTMRWIDATPTVRMTLDSANGLNVTGNVVYNQAINTIAAASTAYTLTASDSGKYVEMSASTANTVTVPSATYTVGTQITIVQTGAGTTTIAPGTNVTINYYSPTSAATRTIKAQWGAATLLLRNYNSGSTVWVLIGNLT